jgi:hypothetical protein
MVGKMLDWKEELGRWLKPFLDRLGHKARRQMCPLYVSGLIGPGDRKSIQPMAERLALSEYDQLHHFIAVGVWDAAPVETELLVQADRLVGGSDAVLVIDDTAIPKKGTHSSEFLVIHGRPLDQPLCQPVHRPRGRPSFRGHRGPSRSSLSSSRGQSERDPEDLLCTASRGAQRRAMTGASIAPPIVPDAPEGEPHLERRRRSLTR